MVTFASKNLTQKVLEGKEKKKHDKTKEKKNTTKPKSKNRYPMIFVGGIGVSTTPEDLIKAFDSEGFSITIYPKIRIGNSFSYCPTVALATKEQVDKILSIGELWVKDRFVDIRKYKSRLKNKTTLRYRAQNPLEKKKTRLHINRNPCYRDINTRKRVRLQELEMQENNGNHDFPPNCHPLNLNPNLYPYFAPSPIPMHPPSAVPSSPMNPNPNMPMAMPPNPNMFMPMAPGPNMFTPMDPSTNMHMPMAPSSMLPLVAPSPIPMPHPHWQHCNTRNPIPVVVHMRGNEILSVNPIQNSQ